MDGVAIIEAIYQVLSEFRVAVNEQLQLSDEAGNDLGPCLSTIGIVSRADSMRGRQVWFGRPNGRPFAAVICKDENDYDLVRLRRYRAYTKGGATFDMEGIDEKDAYIRFGYTEDVERTIDYVEQIE